jgi:hypothetical protein
MVFTFSHPPFDVEATLTRAYNVALAGARCAGVMNGIAT